MEVTGTSGSIDNKGVHLYTLRGKEKMTREIKFNYSHVELQKNKIILTENKNGKFLRKKGTEKF